MDKTYLKERWRRLIMPFTDEIIRCDTFFEEIIQAYSSRGRFFHTLAHITTLLDFIEKYHHLIDKPAVVSFATWYHDFVYDVSRIDNESRSAATAGDRLILLDVPHVMVSTVQSFILATQTHQLTPGIDYFDTRFFLDIDLAVLGSDPGIYQDYTRQIRKEYAIYPEDVYNTGRIKALKSFLNRESIFLTPQLKNSFEWQARQNLEKEIDWLSKGLSGSG